jgi:hypothetical protein
MAKRPELLMQKKVSDFKVGEEWHPQHLKEDVVDFSLNDDMSFLTFDS